MKWMFLFLSPSETGLCESSSTTGGGRHRTRPEDGPVCVCDTLTHIYTHTLSLQDCLQAAAVLPWASDVCVCVCMFLGV